jgi:hypothetical protein
LGTGTGTKEAADRAFDDGQGPEAFRFSERTALPETPQQQLVKAQAGVAERKEKFALATAASKVVNDPAEVLKFAGYSEEDAARLAAVPPPAPAAPTAGNAAGGSRVQSLLASLQ